MITIEDADPRGLIRESYRIEGITEGECKSIFLDWALGIPEGADPRDHIAVLINHYAAGAADHPMTGVLTAGMEKSAPPARRGGRRGRVG